MEQAELCTAPLDLALWQARFQAAAMGCGGAVTFTGNVRAENARGEAVEALVLEHHPRLTLPSMQKIGEEAARRFSLTHWLILHRTGRLSPHEPIVFVAAAAPHRRAAFNAADYMMDHLKSEAVFWKKEICNSGDLWIEPRTDDYSDKERWQNAGN